MKKLFLALAIVSTASTPAQARWRMAESENFVIYAEDSAKDLARFGDQLERYHSAMELLTKRDIPTPSPSNRLTVYVVGNARDVQRIMGTENSNVAGFYSPRAAGSSAFVQDIRVSAQKTHFSMTILLHEYAHHFLISSARHALPRWMNEGLAEFYASARFPTSGAVEIGRPAYHRAGELFYAPEVPLEQVFSYREGRTGDDDFYGRSWLLVHYLTLGGNDERKKQFYDYWQAVATGTEPLDAAKEVFGDLEELDRELGNYLKQRRISMYNLPASWLQVAPVTVHELSDGMDEVLPLMVQSKGGVTREEAAELLPKMREVAADFPNDAGVLAALAEAEFDAGNDDEAIAVADRALALDASQVNAYVQKGYALFRKLDGLSGTELETASKEAMAPFQALNKIENDHPLPLIYFYRSYGQRGEEPPELARHALERASTLAPFDKSLALQVSVMQAQEGKIDLAKSWIEPVAADPHGGQMAAVAKFLAQQFEDGEEGTPLDLAAVVAAMEKEGTAEGGDAGG